MGDHGCPVCSDMPAVLTVGGRPFRCDCGCNVFAPHREKPLVFICNACGQWYQGESQRNGEDT